MIIEDAPATLDDVLRAHHDKLLRRAWQLTGNGADAHDLLQDTLERAARMYHTFAPGSSAAAWLATIMIRIFVDQWRRRRVRGVPVPLDAIEPVVPAEPDEPPAWQCLTLDDVKDALVVLPREWRVLFERQAFADESYATLAAELDLPLATVGSRLFRARIRLRQALQAVHEARLTQASSPKLEAPAPRRPRRRRVSTEGPQAPAALAA